MNFANRDHSSSHIGIPIPHIYTSPRILSARDPLLATVHVLQTRELQFDGTAAGISDRAGDRFGAAGGGQLPELLENLFLSGIGETII